MKKYIEIVGLVAVVSIFCTACEPDYTPKPTGYNRIELPQPKYTLLKDAHPYRFEHSVYAKMLKHKSTYAEAHWIDVYYPNFDATVQLTYKKLSEIELKDKSHVNSVAQEITNDARTLTSKHNMKSSGIIENELVNSHGIKSVVFELEGEVPSQFQFFSTDSTDNFLRGALYFKTATKNDSLAPVIEYIKADIAHMLNTLEWVEMETEVAP